MAQNKIVKGSDNPVVMSWSFSGDFAANGLASFSEITVDIGSESYSTISTPSQLFLNGNNELRLRIGDSTSLAEGQYTLEVIGFSATYNDGYLLSGKCKPVLGAVRVC